MRTRPLYRIILTCALSLSSLSQAADAPPGSKALQILHHEPLQALHFETTVATPSALDAAAAPAAAAVQSTTLSFAAFGRHFLLVLEPNDRLIAALPQAQRQALAQQLRLYRGRIADVEGSWVRLTQRGDVLSGMLWDGTELYVIDAVDEVASSLSQAPAAGAAPSLIYRLSDTLASDAQCALERSDQPVHDYRALVEELRQLLPASAAATQQLNLAIIADTQFVQSNPASPAAAVVTRMNVVDGIFSEQVGVHLNLAEIRPLQNNGPLIATDPGTLLNQLGTFVTSPGFTNPGLTHLFTGRDLNGSVIGIAYLSSLCSARFGVGLSEVRGGGTAGALIVAHELGHNFGAPHDNQGGSACAGTPGTFLMNPFINGSDTFSPCSLDQIRPNVLNAACIADLPNTPSARILAPANGATFVAGTPIQFTGSATDGNGASQTTALVWRSNLDGAIGTGGSFTRILSVGTHTITASVTNSAGNSATASITLRVNANTGAILFSATFDTDAQGFVYVDDAFGTTQPAYASGDFLPTGGFTGGRLRVVLGGLDNTTVLNMSGGWRRTFSLTAPQRVVLSFRYLMVQAANYEPDESSQVLVTIDNRRVGTNGTPVVAQLVGNGNGGPNQSTGWVAVELDLGVLAAGVHTLTLGGLNTKKTFGDETTTVRLDDVIARTLANATPPQRVVRHERGHRHAEQP